MASDEDLSEFRVVLDTNIAVSGLLSPQGAPHAIIDLSVHHRTRLRLGASEENRHESPNLKQFYGCQIVEPGRALALCRVAITVLLGVKGHKLTLTPI